MVALKIWLICATLCNHTSVLMSGKILWLSYLIDMERVSSIFRREKFTKSRIMKIRLTIGIVMGAGIQDKASIR